MPTLERCLLRRLSEYESDAMFFEGLGGPFLHDAKKCRETVEHVRNLLRFLSGEDPAAQGLTS